MAAVGHKHAEHLLPTTLFTLLDKIHIRTLNPNPIDNLPHKPLNSIPSSGPSWSWKLGHALGYESDFVPTPLLTHQSLYKIGCNGVREMI